MIKDGNSINHYGVGSLPRYKYTSTSMHNLVSTPVNMFRLEEERTSKWFTFTNTTCMHRIFTFAWDRENSWNHILNKNLLIEGITRYIHEKKQKQSFREVFSWESHETLMSFRRSWEKMRFSPVKNSRNSHENVIFSWKSHDNLTRFLWVFSSREKNEILVSKKGRERFSWELENSHENLVRFSWEFKNSWEFLKGLVPFGWFS